MLGGEVKLTPAAAKFVGECQHCAMHSSSLAQAPREEWRVEARVVNDDLLFLDDFEHPWHQVIESRFAAHHVIVDAVHLGRLPRDPSTRVDQGVYQSAAGTVDDGDLYDGVAPSRAEASRFGIEVYGHWARQVCG
jgi:hypothetical protein